MNIGRLKTLSASSPAASLSAGNWEPALPEQALSVARKSRRFSDLVVFLDICHALRGVTLNDLQQVHDISKCYSDTWHAGLLLRYQSYARQLGKNSSETKGLLPRGALVKQLDREHRGLNKVILSSRVTLLGTRLDDYPWLLSELSAAKGCHKLAAENPPTVQPHSRSAQVLNNAAALINRVQPFDQLVTDLVKAHSPGISAEKPNVAVVGNSPALLTKSDGNAIDTADIVVRFNHAALSSANTQHLGQRTDLWVISPSTPLKHKPTGARAIGLSGVMPFLRPSRYWKTLVPGELPIAEFSTALWYELVKELQAPPSAGLLVLASLRTLIPTARVTRYGFTEQQGVREQQPNHHGDRQAVSTRHNWERELLWLQQHS